MDARPGPSGADEGGKSASWREQIPFGAMVLTAAFATLGLTLLMVRGHAGLRVAFIVVGSVLAAWTLILWGVRRAKGGLFRAQFVPVKSHWVQASVQFSIMLYWGWFWRPVYAELPLILSQAVFMYTLDALLSWSRGRVWRVGFGPLPIVVSTNLLLWFRHDWYVFQFVMLAIGALGKNFITWERDGRRTHIFNPSAFGQSVIAIVLIATASTEKFTLGEEIAQFFEVPHMLIVIFLGGLVVQYLFHVTLMTASAVATLALFNLVYHQMTGVYFFVNVNIAAPIFLGVHLLLTDPATSPRTDLGRIVFGALYGLGYIALFRVFDLAEIPLFWDKLLPVPVLNLLVPWIDRATRAGLIGRVNGAWEGALRAPARNLVHMALWIGAFATMLTLGFIESRHPGNSIPFWKNAVAQGKPLAGRGLVMAAGSQAEGGGSGAAYNELGLICMEGRIEGVRQSNAKAAEYFARACELNDQSGCVNVAQQFLFLGEGLSEPIIARALGLLEMDCARGGSPRNCYLVGVAYETGRGREKDVARAIELYQQAMRASANRYAAKGLARIALGGEAAAYDPAEVVPVLRLLADGGDTEACWYLAYMHARGVGVEMSAELSRAYLERACGFGSAPACEALKAGELPAYVNPMMEAPAWATAFPTAS